MRGTPSTMISALASAAIAVMNRAVVPDALASRTFRIGSNVPLVPWTRQSGFQRSMRTPNPSRQSTIASVSSLSRGATRVDTPSARDAITSARLVMLFEPGTETDPRTGRLGKIGLFIRPLLSICQLPDHSRPHREIVPPGPSTASSRQASRSDPPGALWRLS